MRQPKAKSSGAAGSGTNHKGSDARDRCPFGKSGGLTDDAPHKMRSAHHHKSGSLVAIRGFMATGKFRRANERDSRRRPPRKHYQAVSMCRWESYPAIFTRIDRRIEYGGFVPRCCSQVAPFENAWMTFAGSLQIGRQKSPRLLGHEDIRRRRQSQKKRKMGPAGFEPATKGLCVPLRLSPPLSSSWAGPSLHFTCLPSGLYTFCP